jgi:hypothetical protein
MSIITLTAIIVMGIAIIILSYKCVKLSGLNKKLKNDIVIAELNENRLEYFTHKLRTQLKYSVLKCGVCGRLVSKKDRRIRHNIPYCPKCYAKIYAIEKGETHDN